MKNKSVWWFLFAGMIITSLAHMKFGVGFIAWIGYAPILFVLKEKRGVKIRLLIYLVMVIGWTIAVLKIISPPIPWFFSFFYSPVIAIFHYAGILFWDHYKDKKYHYLIFPSAMMISEWIMYTLTPFAGWGAAAYTQVDHIVLLQSLSIFGIMGLSFLLYFSNILTLMWIRQKPKKETFIFFLILASLLFYGHIRLGLGQGLSKETVKVAAVGSTSNIKFVGVPEDKKRRRVQRELMERSEKAAQSGAKLIVWPEAATLVFKDEESEWKNKVKEFASMNQVDVVAAYISVNRPFDGKYWNKYLFVTSDGLIDHEYHKHRPVVGEPAVKGRETYKAVTRSYGKVAGAICYDYDYPSVALAHGRLNADIVALPSNDWKGIDPIHTQMAAMRAIENGFSMIRSAQFGLTAGVDPYGKIVGRFSDSESVEKILIVEIPNKKVWTFFSFVTDKSIIAIGVILMLFGILRKEQ